MQLNGFDKIAFVYDRLAQLVYGKSIIDAQKYFLGKIPGHSKILILGGGTGWILQEIFKLNSNVEIYYIEASSKMISLAKEKINNEQIHFVHGTEDNIPQQIQFNVVVTNFYLDLFSDDSMKSVLQKIKISLSSNAQWIVTDFVNEKSWQRLLLKVMYAFFRFTSGIEAKKFPDWENEMLLIEVKEIGSKKFYNGFIETKLYQL